MTPCMICQKFEALHPVVIGRMLLGDACFGCWRAGHFYAPAFGHFCARLAERQEVARMRDELAEIHHVASDLFDYIEHDPSDPLDRSDIVTAIKCAAIELQANATQIHFLTEDRAAALADAKRAREELARVIRTIEETGTPRAVKAESKLARIEAYVRNVSRQHPTIFAPLLGMLIEDDAPALRPHPSPENGTATVPHTPNAIRESDRPRVPSDMDDDGGASVFAASILLSGKAGR